jgi:hypothetical protein
VGLLFPRKPYPLLIASIFAMRAEIPKAARCPGLGVHCSTMATFGESVEMTDPSNRVTANLETAERAVAVTLGNWHNCAQD